MEAIKPGSTHNQWAEAFPQQKQANRSFTIYSPPAVEQTDEPTLIQSDPLSCDSPTAPLEPAVTSDMEPSSSDGVKVTVRTPTPPPRSEISLRPNESYDPYVKANEIALPPLGKRNSSWRVSDILNSDSGSEGPSADSETPIYLKLLPPDETSISQPQSPEHSSHHSKMESSNLSLEIVAELEEQFTPLELDLLVKMFEKHSDTRKAISTLKGRRKSAGDSIFKADQTSLLSSSPQEDSSHLYIRLLDLMQDCSDDERANILPEQDVSRLPRNGSKSEVTTESCQEDSHLHEQCHSTLLTGSDKPTSHNRRAPSRTNPHHGSLKEGNLLRQNAIRQRKGAHSKPKETVTHLSKVS